MAEEDGAAGAPGAAMEADVRVVTRLEGGLALPAGAGAGLRVPLALGRPGLSRLVNHLLGLEAELAKAFEFTVQGKFLRGTLAAHVEKHALSLERALEVEYFLAVAPPQEEEAAAHPDWVAAADGSLGDRLVTGCYDGALRIWAPRVRKDGSVASKCAAEVATHDQPVTAVCVAQGDPLLVLSGSLDGTVKLWALGKKKASCRGTIAVEGTGVGAISSSAYGDKFCVSGWDAAISLWSVEESFGQEPPGKRQRVAEAGPSQASARPVGTLAGHTQRVPAVCWADNDNIYSGSWDHTVKCWDVETLTNTHTLHKCNAVNAVAVNGTGPDADGMGSVATLVACGGSDTVLRVWDPRNRPSDGRAADVTFYSKHKGWITALAWCPGREHHLISAAHDGSVALWDLRSSVPLYTLESHRGKALCADWLGPGLFASGGTDNRVALASVQIE